VEFARRHMAHCRLHFDYIPIPRPFLIADILNYFYLGNNLGLIMVIGLKLTRSFPLKYYWALTKRENVTDLRLIYRIIFLYQDKYTPDWGALRYTGKTFNPLVYHLYMPKRIIHGYRI